jgi:hypothetical protein
MPEMKITERYKKIIGNGSGADCNTITTTLKVTDIVVKGGVIEDLAIRVKGIV